jgi:RNA polymerase-interacting CarD/CdnL/TRCF family regulator
MMFKKGDCVIHIVHGAGILLGVKKMTVNGSRQPYYHIKLLGSDALLMTPVDRAEEINPCPVVDLDIVAAIFQDEPEELNGDYRERQAYIAEKIASGDPQKVIEALRDLLWRKHTAHLSIEDTNLMTKAKHLLVSILALQPGVTMKTSSALLNELLQQIVQAWKASETALNY